MFFSSFSSSSLFYDLILKSNSTISHSNRLECVFTSFYGRLETLNFISFAVFPSHSLALDMERHSSCHNNRRDCIHNAIYSWCLLETNNWCLFKQWTKNSALTDRWSLSRWILSHFSFSSAVQIFNYLWDSNTLNSNWESIWWSKRRKMSETINFWESLVLIPLRKSRKLLAIIKRYSKERKVSKTHKNELSCCCYCRTGSSVVSVHITIKIKRRKKICWRREGKELAGMNREQWESFQRNMIHLRLCRRVTCKFMAA